VRVTGQQLWFRPVFPVGLIPQPDENPTSFLLVGLLPGPDIKVRFFGWVVPALQSHFTVSGTFAPIMYLSSDYTMT
jgi:hypothetical protein